MRKSISINKVKVGDVVHTAYDRDDNLLREDFLVQSEEDISKLKELGVTRATITRKTEDDGEEPETDSDEELADPTGPEDLGQETGLPEPMGPDKLDEAMDQKDEFESSKVLFENTVSKIEQTFVKAHKFDEVNPDDLIPYIERLLDNTSERPANLGVLQQLENYDASLYEHAINTGILSLLFSQYNDLSREKCIDLALASMLHDIGKLNVPNDVIDQQDPLASDAPEEYRSHTTGGFEMLKQAGMDPQIYRPALEHHQRPDGSGYPDLNDEVHPYSKIISVINIYENLTGGHGPIDPVSPNRAFFVLRDEFQEYPDLKPIVHDFIRCLNFYPVGSFVRLTTEDVAVVNQTRDEEPMYPVVYVVRRPDTSWCDEPYPLDLKRVQNQKVSKKGKIYDDEVEILESVPRDEIDSWNQDRVQYTLKKMS